MKKWMIIVLIILGLNILFISTIPYNTWEFIKNYASSNNHDNSNASDLHSSENKDIKIVGSKYEVESATNENTESATNPNQVCYYKQISYSIQNFDENAICIEENCETITCSLEITNLDEMVEGIFKIAFNLKKDESIIDSKDVEISLIPGQKQKIISEFNLPYENQTCEYQTIIIPKKLICE